MHGVRVGYMQEIVDQGAGFEIPKESLGTAGCSALRMRVLPRTSGRLSPLEPL